MRPEQVVEGCQPRTQTRQSPRKSATKGELVDDAIDDDEVDPDQQLLLDRKELHELGLELDNPDGFADQ